MDTLLVNGIFKLHRYPGKGGWTYAEIGKLLVEVPRQAGTVKVKGTIDAYFLKQYRLMPMGGGKLFLPVREEIRKEIKKGSGEEVQVVLYEDNEPFPVPQELVECLKDAGVWELFSRQTEGEQKMYTDWIYSAKRDMTKAERILKTIEKVAKGLKFMSA